jgi:hypothetical protein
LRTVGWSAIRGGRLSIVMLGIVHNTQLSAHRVRLAVVALAKKTDTYATSGDDRSNHGGHTDAAIWWSVYDEVAQSAAPASVRKMPR